jgi:MFS family permease
VLGAGVVAQASYAATGLGLPAIAPAIRRDFGLTLTQTGVVLAASFLGSVPTLLAWGLIADRIGERLVMSIGLTCASGALVWAGSAGASAVPFSGRTKKWTLVPGSYRMSLVATDAAKNASKPKQLSFGVVPG